MPTRVTLSTLPVHFLQWLASSRIRFLEDMKLGRPLKYFSAHLPVMATWNNSKDDFPVNLTAKGIGLIPKKELLMDIIDLFEATIAEASRMPWPESLPLRIEAMERLYMNINNFAPSLLGGLEIFEGTAFKNMMVNPVASLLYIGILHESEKDTVSPERPVVVQYISFQVNGRVEILEKDNIYYRYLLSARRLFEFDKFHLYQPDYPYGYLINVTEVKDKSPCTRRR